MKKHLVVLTGAGISAESGLPTFRDEDGLWMGHDIYKVASPEGWKEDPAMVLEFYNQRRKDVLKVEPNSAHLAIAALQDYFRVSVITQNIDDLHERAGSKMVLHLHGEIFKMKSEHFEENPDESQLFEIRGDIKIGDKTADGEQLRPHVVWFGEPVPEILNAAAIMTTAEAFLLAGTSLQVYPAAGLIDYLPSGIDKYLIDKKPPILSSFLNFHVIENTATEGMKEVCHLLKAKIQ